MQQRWTVMMREGWSKGQLAAQAYTLEIYSKQPTLRHILSIMKEIDMEMGLVPTFEASQIKTKVIHKKGFSNRVNKEGNT